MELPGVRLTVRGVVQGVGFRPFVHRLARACGVVGRVWNHAEGVTIEAFAAPAALQAFAARLRTEAPAGAHVRDVQVEDLGAAAAPAKFTIEASASTAARSVSIPPDLATCDDCLAEIADPAARRYRYPFTNCTACGPRFTIARDVPWDRSATTMAGFTMCPDCRAEFEDAGDRRFHAQPIACPACGPRLQLLDARGVVLGTGDAALLAAARALRAGGIVAIKGLGGFHLACDASFGLAVGRLRERKQREAKPFAVMVRDLAEAAAHAELREEERALLHSPARPVVLVSRLAGSTLAASVAPGNPLVGLLLAYTPLHHLLLAEAGRPLVMTSANLAEEPLAWRDDEARLRLRGLADLFLVHDREIEAPCDDSVARVIGGAPALLRRARGHVPGALRLARPFAQPVLACGALLKNTFCVGAGAEAHLGPHVGDLENVATLDAYEAAIERGLRFLRVQPEVIAHDLHPDYASTRYALARPEPTKVAVQHHHAHVVSLMAEHGLAGPVLGLAWDGAGLGADGTAWGGEFLIATAESFERIASFRPLSLVGGDRAVREVWRLALALVEDAFDGSPPYEALKLFDAVPRSDLHVVRQMLGQRLNTPQARGVGRYFDAFGALGLARPRSAYEGEVALLWNVAADATERGRYAFHLTAPPPNPPGKPWEIDLRLTTRAAVADLLDGRGAATVSARFHRTLVAAAEEVVRLAARRHGRMPIVLTGGCFQNPLLAEGVQRALTPGFEVWMHREVPPGDGGLALGQAVVADAVARKSL
ncbi:MAG: carbamoyltransferase HypF [Vicinamibacteria bacterium]|nr:carbamoyltransferase HypF [Vicinamibacteria bacterium]